MCVSLWCSIYSTIVLCYSIQFNISSRLQEFMRWNKMKSISVMESGLNENRKATHRVTPIEDASLRSILVVRLWQIEFLKI